MALPSAAAKAASRRHQNCNRSFSSWTNVQVGFQGHTLAPPLAAVNCPDGVKAL
jgi:hypothetical protein